MDSSSFRDSIDKFAETQDHQDKIRNPVNEEKRKDIPRGSSANTQPSNANKKPNTRSIVWEHYTRTEADRNKCKCHYCKKIFGCAASSGTSNLQKHLTTCKHFKAWQQRQSQQIIAQDGNLQDAKVSEDVFRKAVNEMIVLGQLPLAFIESIAWRHFCSRVKLYKPLSRRTITRDIVEMYEEKKTALKNWIASIKPKVSITTDIWVAKVTGASYMVITIHFIDENWHLRKLIIGFKYITDHKSQTIAYVLLECLAEWGIQKVFTITVDNATANTSALRKFYRDFKSLSNDALVLDGDFMHIRCCAHIINLIANEGLQDLGDNVAAIRNAIQYVRSSTSRCRSFELKVATCCKMSRGSLPLDVKTRWNSTYLMLSRAIKFKSAFNKMEAEDKLYNDYFLEVENGKTRCGPPSITDWNAIERLVKFLVIFYNSTLVVSGSTSICSYKCYGEIVTIEKNLILLSNSLDKDLRLKADDMRQKFEKYWGGMKQINKLLIVATVFDPRKKMHFAKMCFEKIYGTESSEAKEMYASVFAVLCSLFKEYVANNKGSTSASSQPNQPFSSSLDHVGGDTTDLVFDDMGYERMDSAYKEMVAETRVEDTRDELEKYLKESIENPKTILGLEWDVLSWWKLNSPKYPILSEIAKDVLAMQVSSVASESAFSTSGRIIEPHRSCLTHYVLEVLMCLEQWMKCEMQISEKTFDSNEQILVDVELFDELEKEFDMQVNLD